MGAPGGTRTRGWPSEPDRAHWILEELVGPLLDPAVPAGRNRLWLLLTRPATGAEAAPVRVLDDDAVRRARREYPVRGIEYD